MKWGSLRKDDEQPEGAVRGKIRWSDPLGCLGEGSWIQAVLTSQRDNLVRIASIYANEVQGRKVSIIWQMRSGREIEQAIA